MRAEEVTTAERFLVRIQKQLDIWKITPETRAYVDYHLRTSYPPSGSEEQLLALSLSTSAIDFYQLFCDLAAVAIAEKRERADAFAHAARKLSDATGDPILEKLALVGATLDSLRFCRKTDLLFQDADITGSQPAKKDWVISLEGLAAVGRIGLNIEIENALAGRVNASLKEIEQPGPAGTRSATDLLKIGFMLDKLGFGKWCLAKALEERQPGLVPSLAFECLRFFSTSLIEPFALRLLLPDAMAKYHDYLVTLYPDSASFRAVELDSGMIEIGELSNVNFAPAYKEDFDIRNAIKRNDYVAALQSAQAVHTRLHRPTKLSLRAEVFALIVLDRLEDAIRTCVDWCLRDSQLAIWAPLEELHEAIQASSRPTDHLIEKPILYDLLSKHRDTSFNSLKAYACEDYLLYLGIEKPSQLDITHPPTSKSLLVHFLSEVCTQSALRLSIAYENERELEIELIAICGMLADIDEENSEEYDERAREIVRGRSVKDALTELQQSRVSIDQDALRLWCERTLSEDYDRYITLLKSGIAVVDETYKTQLINALAQGEFPKTLYDVPDNEASALFASLVTRVIWECIYNSEHGLDCYLSLRVRHGTLSGQLRGPVEQEKIVTRRDAASGQYQTNEHWRTILMGNVSGSQLSEILARLALFSRSYDELIADTTDKLIQVRRDEKPDGVFDLRVPELTIYGLATDVNSNTSFESFLDLCFELFWALLEANLVKVRGFIDVDLRAKIRAKFDELEADFIEMPVDAIGWLADSIRRARTETALRLDTMRDWFTLPTPSSAIPFAVKDLIDVALATVKNFKPEFNPIVNIKCEEIPPLSGALRLFSDIFFILFENISVYSGNAKNPHISIEVRNLGDHLAFCVRNTLSSKVDIAKSIDRINAARSTIESGAYLSAVRKEGGTGLPKLAKLIKGKGESPPIKFDLDTERLVFTVDFDVHYSEIVTGEEAKVEEVE